jgi:hypothetical protein
MDGRYYVDDADLQLAVSLVLRLPRVPAATAPVAVPHSRAGAGAHAGCERGDAGSGRHPAWSAGADALAGDCAHLPGGRDGPYRCMGPPGAAAPKPGLRCSPCCENPEAGRRVSPGGLPRAYQHLRHAPRHATTSGRVAQQLNMPPPRGSARGRPPERRDVTRYSSASDASGSMALNRTAGRASPTSPASPRPPRQGGSGRLPRQETGFSCRPHADWMRPSKRSLDVRRRGRHPLATGLVAPAGRACRAYHGWCG